MVTGPLQGVSCQERDQRCRNRIVGVVLGGEHVDMREAFGDDDLVAVRNAAERRD